MIDTDQFCNNDGAGPGAHTFADFLSCPVFSCQGLYSL